MIGLFGHAVHSETTWAVRPVRRWSRRHEPLFSKAHRHVVLQLLCKRLAELIRQDDELVSKIISECQSQAAALQRPDAEKSADWKNWRAISTRKIEYNLRNPGETEEELKESAEACGAWERSEMRLKTNSP